jgi:M6 family metalloprotease-like protein/uncharacterized repeat protein (TIGR01451 family)
MKVHHWIVAACLGLQIVTAQPNPDAATRIRALNQELTTMGAQPRSIAVNRLRDVIRQRQAGFAELAQADPAQALALLLPEASLAPLRVLDGEASSGLESEGAWSGPVDVVAEDDFEHHTSRIHLSLQVGNERFELFSSAPPNLRTGDTIETAGVRMGRMLLARHVSLTAKVSIAASGCTTTGTQHLAILLVNFQTSSINTSVINSTSMGAIVTGGTHNLTSYWNEASYGLTSAAADVFGPFNLNADFPDGNIESVLAATLTAAGSVNFPNYTHVVIVMPNGFPSSGGFGSVGCRNFYSPSTFTAGVVWVRADFMTPNDVGVCALAHENGHNMGLDHASRYAYSSVPLGGFVTTPAFTDYGSDFSLMSLCFTYNGNTLLGHYDAQHKVALGWFVPTNYQTVSANGSFVLAPTETNTSALHAIRVQRGQQNNIWLWLEYRQNQGYDSTFSGFDGQIYSGAMIHFEDPTDTAVAGHTLLLNYSAPAKPDFSEPALAVGSSWSDPYSALTLSATSADASGLHVTVHYDALCASFTPPNRTYSSSGAVTGDTVAVTAGGTCSWTAITDQSWITITGGASVTGPGTVTYSLAANTTPQTRTGIITIGRQSFTITQASSNPQPTPVSISPVNNSSVAGSSKTFTVTFSDAAGAGNLATAAVLFSSDSSATAACSITWAKLSGSITLASDNPDEGGFSAPQNGHLTNSQCFVDFTNPVAISGNNLTMTLQITFTATFLGVKTVYMEATDSLGADSGLVSKGTWSVSSSATPSLTIAKSHSGNFGPGQLGAQYTVTVSNAAGAASTNGTVTVTETVPAGMTLVSMAGANWSCGSNKCTRNDALSGGTHYDPISVTVNVSSGAPSSLTNQVAVSGGGATTVSTTDPTTIVPLSACDATLDGTTNVLDIQRIVSQALGTYAPTDLNQDGKVNVVDSQIVIRAVLSGTCTH